MKYALINDQNMVVNIIEWDGQSPLDLPFRLIQSEDAQLHYEYIPETDTFKKIVEGES